MRVFYPMKVFFIACYFYIVLIGVQLCLIGDAPFGNTENMSRYEVFNRISEGSVPYPFFMSFSLKTLIGGLLEKNDQKRWSYEQVSTAAWVKEVSFLLYFLS